MNPLYDVPGFSEANAHYENMHPDDLETACSDCDGDGCEFCEPEDEEDEE